MKAHEIEKKLLLLATQPGERKAELSAILDSKLDWDFIVKMAFGLEIVPLFYRGLSPFLKGGKIPAGAVSALKKQVCFVTGLNLGYFRELKRLVAGFDKAGIPVCLLKGAAVCMPVYESISLRSFGDIDILIKPNDLEGAIKLFGSNYQLDYFLPTLDMCKKYHFHVSLIRKKVPAYCFEIHWSLFTPDSSLNLPPASLWENTSSFEFEGVTFKTLSPENMFLHTVIHFTRNAFSSPRDLWDIHWLLSRGSVDFEVLREKLRKFKLEKRAAVCLLFVDHLFKTSYIQKLGIKGEIGKFLRQRISLSFLLHRKKHADDNDRALISFLLQDGFREKTSFLKHIIYPGIYWLTIYPSDFARITPRIRLKIALRGIRLIFWIFRRATRH